MKANKINSSKSDLTAKVAFVTRLLVYPVVVVVLLMIIAKIRITARDYHLKQQKQRQTQLHK